MTAVLLLFVALDMLLIGSPFHFLYSDAWEHTANLAELLRSPFAPGNPHIATDEASPRFMPLFIAAGWLGQTLGLGVFDVYLGLELFNLALLLTGVYLFARAYLDDERAPTLLLLLLLFAWGSGIVWSNAYALRSIPFIAGYPSTAAMGLTFLLWFLALRFYRLPVGAATTLQLLIIMSLLTLTLLVHVLTGVIGIGGLLLLALTQPAPSLARRLQPLLTIPLAVLLVELWPYYSTLSFLLPDGEHAASSWTSAAAVQESRATRLMRIHPFYQPGSILPSLGIAWLAIPISLLMALRGKHLFAFLGMSGLFGLYLLNLATAIPLGHRALLFAVIFGQIALAAWLLQAMRERREHGHGSAATIGIAVLCLGIASGLALTTFKTLQRVQAPDHWVPVYSELLRGLHPTDVVMGRAADTWPLPSFGGKTISPHHRNPLIRDGGQRARDVDTFFDETEDDTNRRALLSKYAVNHLLLRPQRPLDQALQASFCTPGSEQRVEPLLLCRVN